MGRSRAHLADLIVVLALVAGAIGLATASPASAHTGGGAATGGTQWHPWTSDACSWVPDRIPRVFDFSHACQHHDGCYRGHWASRATCDRRFLDDMRASCRTSTTRWWNRPSCHGWAWTYFAGVRMVGATPWRYYTHLIPLR